MLDDVRIRDARPDEANFAAEMTRKMLVELEQYGGRAAAKSDTAWDKVAALIGADLGHDTTKHVVAETAPDHRIGYAAARIVNLEGPFEPKTTVHVGVLYVVPGNRLRGVARRLLANVFEWGQAKSAEYCTLNVLAKNPAKSLYQSLGFLDTDIQMTRRF